jgi:hypothetical protein
MGLNRYLYYYSLGKINISWQRAIKVVWLETGTDAIFVVNRDTRQRQLLGGLERRAAANRLKIHREIHTTIKSRERSSTYYNYTV